MKPGTTDVEAIRGWMTIPYITTAYGVPEEYIFKEIGIPVKENRKKSLSQLNLTYAFGQKGVIVGAVKAAVNTYQEKHLAPSESNHE
ncbi:MAG: hypothetical protein GY801_35060 [bacterium]|nr:hypothetical protein [bacterium]